MVSDLLSFRVHANGNESRDRSIFSMAPFPRESILRYTTPVLNEGLLDTLGLISAIPFSHFYTSTNRFAICVRNRADQIVHMGEGGVYVIRRLTRDYDFVIAIVPRNRFRVNNERICE